MKTNLTLEVMTLNALYIMSLDEITEVRREMMYPSTLVMIRHSILGYVNAWIG